MKEKIVPIKVEKEYVKLDKQFDIINLKHELAKKNLLAYKEKGYSFQLIKFSDTSAGVRQIKWKEVAHTLMDRFMSKSVKATFERAILRKYPPVERTPTVLVIGKKVKDVEA